MTMLVKGAGNAGVWLNKRKRQLKELTLVFTCTFPAFAV